MMEWKTKWEHLHKVVTHIRDHHSDSQGEDCIGWGDEEWDDGAWKHNPCILHHPPKVELGGNLVPGLMAAEGGHETGMFRLPCMAMGDNGGNNLSVLS